MYQYRSPVPLYLWVFVLTYLELNFVNSSTPSCNPSNSHSFCVKKNDECELSLHYQSYSANDCPTNERCCAYRRNLPPVNGRHCGISYKGQGQLAGSFRIVGGEESIAGQWPWAVSIEEKDYLIYNYQNRSENRFYFTHICGGVLIAPDMVLTAGHCFPQTEYSPGKYRVAIGQHNKNIQETFNEIRKVKTIIKHERFDHPPRANDIAILVLDRPVEYSAYVQPICLPKKKLASKTPAICYVTGWGVMNKKTKQTAEILRHVEVKIRSKKCKAAYRGQYRGRTNVCASSDVVGRDACQGDSGGALACLTHNSNWQVVGVVSWGHNCGARGKPGIYTSVSAYRPWISEKTKSIIKMQKQEQEVKANQLAERLKLEAEMEKLKEAEMEKLKEAEKKRQDEKRKNEEEKRKNEEEKRKKQEQERKKLKERKMREKSNKKTLWSWFADSFSRGTDTHYGAMHWHK